MKFCFIELNLTNPKRGSFTWIPHDIEAIVYLLKKHKSLAPAETSQNCALKHVLNIFLAQVPHFCSKILGTAQYNLSQSEHLAVFISSSINHELHFEILKYLIFSLIKIIHSENNFFLAETMACVLIFVCSKHQIKVADII